MTNRALLAFTAATTMCSTDETASGSFFTCSDYQVMIDVELNLADNCQTDSECTQVLSGTGCGCGTDDRIASVYFDTSYFYDLSDEASIAGCNIDFGTDCTCPPNAEPACVSGSCVWN